jgi:Ca-activated chloride channel family protein
MSWDFLAPGRLWLLLVVLAMVVVYVLAQQRRARHTVRFTQIELLDQIAPRRPGWRRHAVAGLQMSALVVGIFAAAQPVKRTTDRPVTEGRIILLFDVSLSMEATDVAPNRFESARDAASEFVDQVDPQVEIGLVSFSADVATEVALTTDRGKVQRGIDELQLGLGTAIGDALFNGVRALQRALDDADASDGVRPGAIVLITDGETTFGRPTQDGAELAAEAEVPVYTIAFGTPDGTVEDPETGDEVPVPVKLEELQQVADTTGGQAFAAPSASDLADAYDAISEELDITLAEPEEIVLELAWRYALVAALLLAAAVMLGVWWLRGPL